MTTRRPGDSQYPAADVDVVVVEATVSRVTREPSTDQPTGLWRAARLVLGVAETVGDTVAVPVERRSQPAVVGWNVAVGAGLLAGAGVGAAGRLAARIVRPVASVVLHPPLVPEEWHPARGVEALARLGGQERASARRDLDRMVTAVMPVVAEEVVARIDLDAIIARIDIAGLAEEVIESIDLPEIIRESTGTVASEVVRGVRMQSIDADEVVARVVDRLFFRRRRRATDALGEPLSVSEVDGVDLTAPAAGDGARPQAPT
ncbi:MAG TPA: hypothetical protein VFH23_11880 [Jiangellaceae bacterium]|jgi:hypothetical protein|nr:hypothetical protein [Jiangellaceae bacterium]